MDYNIDTIALRGRGNASVSLIENDSVVITSDILKHNSGEKNTTITLDSVRENIQILSNSIELFSNNPPPDIANNPQSIVYGERLVEILKWIINTLETHSHPPNAPPVNTFFTQAAEYRESMDSYILNHNIKTK